MRNGQIVKDYNCVPEGVFVLSGGRAILINHTLYISRRRPRHADTRRWPDIGFMVLGSNIKPESIIGIICTAPNCVSYFSDTSHTRHICSFGFKCSWNVQNVNIILSCEAKKAVYV